MPSVSILMPTYEHERFIGRAIESVLAQTFTDWELIIIDDASPDATHEAIDSFLEDPRIVYMRLAENVGYTDALNVGLSRARGEYVAYLPSDDLYFPEHLSVQLATLEKNPDASAAVAGVRHHYNREAYGPIAGHGIQLVQIIHRSIDAQWTGRKELVSDDLELLFWQNVRRIGRFAESGRVTCEWVDHPDQLHKIIREPVGGINTFRSKFRIKHPLRFKSSVGNATDEEKLYERFRETSPAAHAKKKPGLKIVLVGELAYNAERVLALEEAGHTVYGLWMPEPYWYNTVGPLPFGHVEDIPHENWRARLREIEPDIIYGLLNWQAVPFAAEVLRAVNAQYAKWSNRATPEMNIPFVWHFKEGPFICLEKGSWGDLVDLYRFSDAQIYTSPEMREWMFTVLPALRDSQFTLDLDGDLPKREWFSDERSRLISEIDGEIHTVVPGRPIGLHPHNVKELGELGIHLHFYGDFTHGQWREWIEKAERLAPEHLHLHANVGPDRWVEEFSKYDAGWLHSFESTNRGEIRKANWDDLNYPARMSTLAAAGVPMIQYDNSGSLVATQTLVRRLDIGVFYRSATELASQLRNRSRMADIRANVWQKRTEFMFDTHVPRLVGLFDGVIEHHRRATAGADSARSQDEPAHPQQKTTPISQMIEKDASASA